ncbi:MAG: hypothetical protein AAGF56_07765, partial [Pseudomonadota bacterium]
MSTEHSKQLYAVVPPRLSDLMTTGGKGPTLDNDLAKKIVGSSKTATTPDEAIEALDIFLPGISGYRVPVDVVVSIAVLVEQAQVQEDMLS